MTPEQRHAAAEEIARKFRSGGDEGPHDLAVDWLEQILARHDTATACLNCDGSGVAITSTREGDEYTCICSCVPRCPPETNPDEFYEPSMGTAPVGDAAEGAAGEIERVVARFYAWKEMGVPQVHSPSLEVRSIIQRAISASERELVEALEEARLQIEYMHGKLGTETGSGIAVLAKIAAALAKRGRG